jgi:hypothetical protein
VRINGYLKILIRTLFLCVGFTREVATDSDTLEPLIAGFERAEGFDKDYPLWLKVQVRFVTFTLCIFRVYHTFFTHSRLPLAQVTAHPVLERAYMNSKSEGDKLFIEWMQNEYYRKQLRFWIIDGSHRWSLSYSSSRCLLFCPRYVCIYCRVVSGMDIFSPSWNARSRFFEDGGDDVDIDGMPLEKDRTTLVALRHVFANFVNPLLTDTELVSLATSRNIVSRICFTNQLLPLFL